MAAHKLLVKKWRWQTFSNNNRVPEKVQQLNICLTARHTHTHTRRQIKTVATFWPQFIWGRAQHKSCHLFGGHHRMVARLLGCSCVCAEANTKHFKLKNYMHFRCPARPQLSGQLQLQLQLQLLHPLLTSSSSRRHAPLDEQHWKINGNLFTSLRRNPFPATPLRLVPLRCLNVFHIVLPP